MKKPDYGYAPLVAEALGIDLTTYSGSVLDGSPVSDIGFASHLQRYGIPVTETACTLTERASQGHPERKLPYPDNRFDLVCYHSFPGIGSSYFCAGTRFAESHKKAFCTAARVIAKVATGKETPEAVLQVLDYMEEQMAAYLADSLRVAKPGGQVRIWPDPGVFRIHTEVALRQRGVENRVELVGEGALRNYLVGEQFDTEEFLSRWVLVKPK